MMEEFASLAKRDDLGVAAADLMQLGVSWALDLVTALLLLVAGFTIAGWVSRLIRRRLGGIKRFDKTLIPVLSQIARYTILVFTLVLVLSEFGVQTASIIAVLGAAGLAIGLALQGTLQNVAAGLMLLVLRPFRVGDVIETSAGVGTVREIGIFITEFATPDGIYMTVPNSQIWSGPITNFSELPTRRLQLGFGISYEDDIDRARKLALELAGQESRILETPAPQALVTGLGDSSVDLELRVWTRREDYWDVRFEMTRIIKYALDKAGISIPYPHRQVIMPPPPKKTNGRGRPRPAGRA
ncbi:MAG: mechanosensitive ion channel family protein [Hyphomicrobiales bacterium]